MVSSFYPSNAAFHIFGPSGELKQTSGDNLQGAHELTLVVEGNKEFLWLTDQYSGAAGEYKLAGKHLAPIEQARSMPHALTWAAVSCVIAKSGWPADTSAM